LLSNCCHGESRSEATAQHTDDIGFSATCERDAAGVVGVAVGGRLGIHRRSARDFLDALVALGFLRRTGNTYANTPETDLFLDRAKPSYIGGILLGLDEKKRDFRPHASSRWSGRIRW